MNDLERKMFEEAKRLSSPLGLVVEGVEYVKEGGMMILRIIVDKEGGLEIEDTARLSEVISARLDELDPIQEDYCLEVCSPGLEKPIKTKEELTKHIGKFISVKTMNPNIKNREWTGTLVAFDGSILTLNVKVRTISKTIEIEYDQIAEIKTAIEF